MAGDHSAKRPGDRKRPEDILGLAQFSIERASEEFLWTDSNGCFVYANEAACRTLGYSREELFSLTVPDIDPDFPAERWPAHWRQLREQDSLTFESRQRAKDGKIIPVEVSVNHIEFGGAEYNVAIVRDITERKRAEEELKKQQEIVRELSTPVLPVSKGLLIVPLIGAVDAVRARQLTEQLLRHIRLNRARAVVIDITGVPTMDANVANHLIQTAEASRLLGARVIVTGMSREIAQTLVTLGVNLSKVTTMGDLQSGIEEPGRILEQHSPAA